MMIKWCLNLKLMSSSAYSALCTSGALTLPSERTLRDYTHFIKPDVGFSNEVDLQLLKEARLESARKTKQYVCLIFDEVKVKENLVYDKHSGEMIGFTDIGDINNCLEEFRRDCEENRQKPQLATHMLVFMVSGIVSKLNYPYAQFPCISYQLIIFILLCGVVYVVLKELVLRCWQQHAMVHHVTEKFSNFMVTLVSSCTKRITPTAMNLDPCFFSPMLHILLKQRETAGPTHLLTASHVHCG